MNKILPQSRATGNPGMPTPYDQGYDDAVKGYPCDNPYNQPGEENENAEYLRGYQSAVLGLEK